MPLYSPPSTGDTASDAYVNLDANFQAVMAFQAGATEPMVVPLWSWWMDTSVNMLRVYNGASFSGLIDIGNTVGPLLDAGGGVAFQANLSAGGNKLINLGPGSQSTGSIQFDQAVIRSGVNAMTGDLDLGGHRVVNAADGVAATDLATVGQAVTRSGSQTITDAQDGQAYLFDTGIEFVALIVTYEWRNVAGNQSFVRTDVITPSDPVATLVANVPGQGDIPVLSIDASDGTTRQFSATPAFTNIDPNDITVRWVAF